MAVDGVQLDIPDTNGNEEVFRRGDTHRSLDDLYPEVKIVGPAECATHVIIDAEIGAVTTDERQITRPLLAAFTPGILMIADRGLSATTYGARPPTPAPIFCGGCSRD